MNLSVLRSMVAAYHRLTSTADFTIGGVDMFLASANNARRSAELQHNFEYARVSGTIMVDGVNGANLNDLQYEGQIGVNVSTPNGPVSPDPSGQYNMHGTYNGAPFYLRLTSNPLSSFVLWYDNVAGVWHINPFTYFQVTTAAGTAFSTNIGTFDYTGPATSPAGTYTTTFPGYSGSPVVSIGAFGTTNFNSFKEVVSIQRYRPDGIRVPMDFSNPDVPIERDRTRWELDRFWSSDLRWPSDADILQNTWAITMYQRGNYIYRYPKPIVAEQPLQVHVEGYGWLMPYYAAQLTNSPDPAAPAEDFVLQYGEEYMLWKIVCDLNPLFGTFVPREEGNVASPENQLAAAWDKFLKWDAYLVDSHSTRSR